MTDSSRWIRRFRLVPDAAVKLVCLPHAGGTASYYRPLTTAMPALVEVLTVQYPGRQDRAAEPGATDFAEFADRVHEALAAEADRPLALFGHSMGALLSYEVTKRMEAAGTPPVTLLTSAMGPKGPKETEPRHTATDEQLIAEIAALSGTEPRLLDNLAMRELFLPALRADYQALESYRLGETRVSTPVVALTGDDDNRCEIADAAAWEGQTTGGFDLHVFTGGHFYLADQWEGVAEVLRTHLNAHV